MSSRDEIKALRARLDAMQSRLADAKKDIAAGKDQVAKTKGKNLQSLQDQAAALNRDRKELKKISDEMNGTNSTDDTKSAN